MKISFCDFWDGFQAHHNFFLDLFKSINDSVELSSVEDCDVLIYSCFGSRHRSFSPSSKIKIFYTGENLRPNFSECTYSFTFDFESYGGRNIRIPLWLLQIDWFNKKDYENPKYIIPYEEIDDNRFIRNPKNKFCCTVFNTIKPERIEMYKILSQYKQVDGFGRPFNNWSYGEDNKLNILSNYKFSICFENTVYSGYFTEKLIHAKVGGTVPIYSGDKAVEQDFNKRSFINIQDYASLQDAVDVVKQIDNTPELYKSYINEKLFNNDPRIMLNNIKDEIKYLLKL